MGVPKKQRLMVGVYKDVGDDDCVMLRNCLVLLWMLTGALVEMWMWW